MLCSCCAIDFVILRYVPLRWHLALSPSYSVSHRSSQQSCIAVRFSAAPQNLLRAAAWKPTAEALTTTVNILRYCTEMPPTMMCCGRGILQLVPAALHRVDVLCMMPYMRHNQRAIHYRNYRLPH